MGKTLIQKLEEYIFYGQQMPNIFEDLPQVPYPVGYTPKAEEEAGQENCYCRKCEAPVTRYDVEGVRMHGESEPHVSSLCGSCSE